jgi:hydrogenase-4 component B
MSERLILAGILLNAVSGVPGLFLSRHSGTGQRLAALLAVAGCLLGMAGVGAYWTASGSLSAVQGTASGSEAVRFPWPIPGGEFHVQVDGLSALFLAPVFLVALLGSIYGLSYWRQQEHPANGRGLRLFYGLLPAGMALLVIARNSLLFLAGWELMALSAFFLVTTEDHDREVRAAGWIYLVATHCSTLCLFALFALLGEVGGSFTLEPIPAERLPPEIAWALFVLAMVGFGLKAGLMPLHVWLPSSHAIAPSHVSALMSGVILKMGIYGIARITSLLPNPPQEWGWIVLALGIVSGVLGVAYAIAQHDLKRLLAYHSIENIGIIALGLGLALLGRSFDRADWIVLGLAGALLHVWNHALFKALLFLSAGSVIHATHTREIDHLGGLLRRMPWTAACFLVGAVAICGLPPLNGFVSELFIYLGLFHSLDLAGTGSAAPFGAVLAVPALSLIGALALACFVKVFGAVFLGTGRSRHVDIALGRAGHGLGSVHEAGPAMIAPMLVLAGCCLLIGLAPALLVGVLGQAITAWSPNLIDAEERLASGAPLAQVSLAALLLLAATAAAWAIYSWLLRRSPVAQGPTWGCGYAAPTSRMQYSASSFAEMLVGLFAWALRPSRQRPRDLPLFPPPSRFHSEVPDAVLDRTVLPAFRVAGWLAACLHGLQRGSIQVYLLYIFLILVALLVWR